MKTLLLTIFLFMSASVIADDKPTQEEIDYLCERLHDHAITLHEFRYDGVPLASLLEDIGTGIMREIIIDAYEQPLYSTERIIQTARREFGIKWQLICLNTKWTN